MRDVQQHLVILGGCYVMLHLNDPVTCLCVLQEHVHYGIRTSIFHNSLANFGRRSFQAQLNAATRQVASAQQLVLFDPILMTMQAVQSATYLRDGWHTNPNFNAEMLNVYLNFLWRPQERGVRKAVTKSPKLFSIKACKLEP